MQYIYRNILYPASQIFNPQLRPNPAALVAMNPKNPLTSQAFSPRLFESSSLRWTNASVDAKLGDVSCVITTSALAYTAARETRLVYQDASTEVSDARVRMSEDMEWSSEREAGTWVGRDIKASA